jgi:hypothetical protein
LQKNINLETGSDKFQDDFFVAIVKIEVLVLASSNHFIQVCRIKAVRVHGMHIRPGIFSSCLRLIIIFLQRKTGASLNLRKDIVSLHISPNIFFVELGHLAARGAQGQVQEAVGS